MWCLICPASERVVLDATLKLGGERKPIICGRAGAPTRPTGIYQVFESPGIPQSIFVPPIGKYSMA